MSISANKQVVQTLVDRSFNGGAVQVLGEIVAEDFHDNSPMPGIPQGRKGFQMFVQALHNAFNDFHLTVRKMIAEDDMVVIIVILQGTNTGTLLGLPPTSKEATWTATHSYRLEKGKIVEHWGNIDMMSLMKQLGHAA